jgi:hypothetical protein
VKYAMLTTAFLLATATACEQKPKDELTPPAVQPAQPAQPAIPANAPPPAANLEQVPVAEDFEEQAERDITASNADSELDKLDQEIVE